MSTIRDSSNSHVFIGICKAAVAVQRRSSCRLKTSGGSPIRLLAFLYSERVLRLLLVQRLASWTFLAMVTAKDLDRVSGGHAFCGRGRHRQA